ncbi:MAG: WD40 repeat domain-containing protein [Polyangiales bacterium]
MRPSSRPPHRWTDCPPAAADALARPTVAWGSRRGRLPSPRAVRIADAASLAWGLCAPPDARPTLTAWNPRNARIAWRYELPRAGVFDVSPDGALLIFTDATGWCLGLDATRGVELTRFDDACGDARAVIVSRGPQRAVLIARSGKVRRCDLDTLRVTHEFDGDTPAALSTDGRAIAFSNRERTRATVVRGDAPSENFAVTRGRHLTAIDLDDDGVVTLGHDDGSVSRRDSPRGGRVVTGAVGSPVTALRASGAGEGLLIASGHLDGVTRLASGDPRAPGAVHGGGVVDHVAPSLRAALHREANAAVLVSLDPVERFDLREGHGDAVTAIALARDGRVAVTASRDGTLRVWDPRDGRTLDTLEGHLGPVRSVVLSPDARTAWSSGECDGLRAWDLDRAMELWHEPALARLDALAVSSDGARLLAQRSSQLAGAATALLLDACDGRLLARESIPSVVRGALGFSADASLATLAFAACNEGGLRLTHVDARDGSDARSLIIPAPHRSYLTHRITADGHVATGTTDSAVLTVRDLVTGAPRARHATGAMLLRHTHLVIGARVAIGTTGGARVDVCELGEGISAALRLPHAHDAVTSLALSSDERWFAAGTAQGLCLRYELREGKTPPLLS